MKYNDHSMSKTDFKIAIFERGEAERRAAKYELVFKIYGVLGIIVAVLGAAYFVITIIDFELSKDQRLGLLVSLTGFVIGMLSFLALNVLRQKRTRDVKRSEYNEYLWEFLDSWISFERTGRHALSSNGAEFSSNSIRHVIEELVEFGLIERNDVSELLEAMRARNAMLHGGDEVPAHVIRDYSEFLLGITSKLSSRSGLTVP